MSAIEKVQKFSEVYSQKRIELANVNCKTLAGTIALVEEYKKVTGEKSGNMNDAIHFFAYREAQKEVRLF